MGATSNGVDDEHPGARKINHISGGLDVSTVATGEPARQGELDVGGAVERDTGRGVGRAERTRGRAATVSRFEERVGVAAVVVGIPVGGVGRGVRVIAAGLGEEGDREKQNC